MSSREKLEKDAYRFCNERARLELALRRTFESLGVGEVQIDTIIAEAKVANFGPLDKTIKRQS
tara:strand:- start:81966 stop:82154 length:189 start_codon:yes stop_codon:yes gene_type:complete